MDDFAIGDMGVVDQFGLAAEIPSPQILDDADMSTAAISGPGGLSASMAEVGLAPSAASLFTQEGIAGVFGGSLDVPVFGSETLGSLPGIESPGAPSAEVAYIPDAQPALGPSAFSSPGGAAFSDAPFASDGSSASLGAVMPIDLPSPPGSPFAGATSSPAELLDLQLALTPPEPSQEGFPGASDAPMPAAGSSFAAPFGGEHSSTALMAMSASISEKVWGSSSPSGSSSSSKSTGPSISIQNLHLPAASPREFTDQLLASAPDLSNSNLSALG